MLFPSARCNNFAGDDSPEASSIHKTWMKVHDWVILCKHWSASRSFLCKIEAQQRHHDTCEHSPNHTIFSKWPLNRAMIPIWVVCLFVCACNVSLSLQKFLFVSLVSPLLRVWFDNIQTRVMNAQLDIYIVFFCRKTKRIRFCTKTGDNLVCLFSISGPNSGLIE